MRRNRDVRNYPRKKDELSWILHENKLSDDECNRRNDRWNERMGKGKFPVGR